MPLFSHTSGVNINGGSFYDVSGDMIVQNSEQLAVQEHQVQVHKGVGRSQDVWEGPSTEYKNGGQVSLGVPRNSQQTGIRQPVPSDVSARQQIGSQKDSPHPEGRSNGRLDNPPLADHDDHNTTARLSHLRGVNPPGGDFGSNNGALSSHASPWVGDAYDQPRMNIHGGTFIGGNINSGETGLHILHRSVSLEAMHDSADNDAQPKCHPETRTKMLEKLYNWCIASEWSDAFEQESQDSEWESEDSEQESEDSHPEQDSTSIKVVPEACSVLWLYGPAGAGKSAIMRTLAERLADSSQFGGSFFFKRGHPTCGNSNKLFATLAYQLAFNIPHLKARISNIIAETPAVVSKSIKVQLQKLIAEPCRQLDTLGPITVIIDGLDECNDPQEVLHCVGNSIRKLDSFPLQFLIVSRPEPNIREIFQGSLFHALHHSFNVEKSLEDVRKYLEDEFSRIHREHHQTMARVPNPWPSQNVIEYLVEKSSGYFTFAVTVIKFVDDKNFRPTEQLEELQDSSHLESPFNALDRLYTQILSTVPARHGLLPILRALEFFDFELPTCGIEQLLGLKAGDVQLILRNLHSVLFFPEHDDDDEYPIRVHHASFRDFLNDQARSGEFYVGELPGRVELGKSILNALSYTPAIHLPGPVNL
ncbi:hypothetical protein C8J57DRAFT_1190790 [Mycena rebaudengoi]|nr:hypothetical protein C8J57DRAFT_1190790 [Mycena rebaudengoi]